MTTADQWAPSGELALEPNALAAARSVGGSVLLSAGPGSGKTELLAQRADFLLKTGSCRFPRRILAISFKVDAAKNLRERVRRRSGWQLGSRLDSLTFHAFAKRIIDQFRPLLTGMNALDANYSIGPQRLQGTQISFNDMIPLAVEIVESSRVVRNAILQTYSHVFLDEFQDCTGDQYKLIKALFYGSKTSITAVGDKKQTIMHFAGALKGVFQQFSTDFDAIHLPLYQNYRSRVRLRRMQNNVVKVIDPQAALPDHEVAGEDGIIEAYQFDDAAEEAEWIAQEIEQAITVDGQGPQNIAILLAKQVDLYAQDLKRELRMRNIPHRDEASLQDLSSEPVTHLIVDFLTVVVGRRQPAAFHRLMETVLNDDPDEDQFEERQKWHSFFDTGRSQLEENSELDARQLVSMSGSFLDALGQDRLKALTPSYERGPHLAEVIAKTFNQLTLLMAEGLNALTALRRFSDDSSVRILTIHKCKGLEFDTVYMLGIEKEMFWGAIEEERQTFFVGISRAKRRLVLTCSKHRETPAGARRWQEARTPQYEFMSYASSAMA